VSKTDTGAPGRAPGQPGRSSDRYGAAGASSASLPGLSRGMFSSSPAESAALTATPRSRPTTSPVPVPGPGIGAGTAANAMCLFPARSRVTRHDFTPPGVGRDRLNRTRPALRDFGQAMANFFADTHCCCAICDIAASHPLSARASASSWPWPTQPGAFLRPARPSSDPRSRQRNGAGRPFARATPAGMPPSASAPGHHRRGLLVWLAERH
jgi:hypothetical protein